MVVGHSAGSSSIVSVVGDNISASNPFDEPAVSGGNNGNLIGGVSGVGLGAPPGSAIGVAGGGGANTGGFIGIGANNSCSSGSNSNNSNGSSGAVKNSGLSNVVVVPPQAPPQSQSLQPQPQPSLLPSSHPIPVARSPYHPALGAYPPPVSRTPGIYSIIIYIINRALYP